MSDSFADVTACDGAFAPILPLGPRPVDGAEPGVAVVIVTGWTGTRLLVIIVNGLVIISNIDTGSISRLCAQIARR